MKQSIILFDLGGVLVDLGDPTGSIGLDMSNKSFWNTWLSSPLVQKYETGKLSTKEFLEQFATELEFSSNEDFGQAIRRWNLPVYHGAEIFLTSLLGNYTVALLSNINEIHWQNVQLQTDVFSTFSKLFLSFESGNRKPDREAYEDVVNHFACDPADIIFLDDMEHNVEAARAVGMRAQQVNGLVEAQQALTDLS